MKTDKISTYALIAIIASVLICYPFIMGMTSASYPSWNFTSTGQIGDTVGGLTAPIIGLLNAVLLFFTLRKQDAQINQQNLDRHEDNLNALIDRKVDLIQKKLASIKLDVDYAEDREKTGLAPLEKLDGEYRGIPALEFLNVAVFEITYGRIGFYKIRLLQWNSLMSVATFSIIEAAQAMQRNFQSDLSVIRKKENYEYLTAQIIDVIKLYNSIELYIRTYPGDPGITKMHLVEKLKFKHYINVLALYDPEPNLKESNLKTTLPEASAVPEVPTE